MASLEELLEGSLATAGPAIKATFGVQERTLSATEFREFWRDHRMFAVATAAKDGAPHIAPVHVLLTDDDQLEMAIFENSVRLRDLRRDPRIAITTWTDDGRIAIVYGRCSEVEGSRRELPNRGALDGPSRFVLTMRIAIDRLYAMNPRRGQT
ncbi:MAG TPA: pyridoxamine 5'-phosphate oxidase family protein [Dehalococcoidia bacterium]|nr:pyridoxamine 5'-phosphate oxidase family protein [Dehalococcoidia bacterium]